MSYFAHAITGKSASDRSERKTSQSSLTILMTAAISVEAYSIGSKTISGSMLIGCL
jgi:hypothetical protein